MPVKPPQATPVRGFGLGTKKATQTLPVRTLIVDTDAPLGSNAFEESVRRACLAAKAAEQLEMEQKDDEQNVRDIE
jgi:hypothetical protein